MKKIIMPRENAFSLIKLIRNRISDEELLEYMECAEVDKTDSEIDLLGVSNGFLSEVVHTITSYEVEVYGEVEELFPCPCCGYRTLTECYDSMEGTGYDICPYCNWEDDGTTDIHSRRSINGGSIQDYRDKIKANPNRYYINKWIKE